MAGEGEQVKVLSAWASPFGMRVLIALEEKAVPYQYHEEEDVLNNKSQLLLQTNPIYRKIPVLIHNGNPICESLITLHYIDEAWPQNPLLPSHPFARAQARFWADFIDNKFYDCGFRIVRSKGEAQQAANRDMVGCLEVLEGVLREIEGPYFGGRDFGLMDIAFIPFTSWFAAYESIGNFEIALSTHFPLLQAWIHRCMARESVKRILPDPQRISQEISSFRKSLDDP